MLGYVAYKEKKFSYIILHFHNLMILLIVQLSQTLNKLCITKQKKSKYNQRERERERKRERQRETERDRGTERDTERHREGGREGDTGRETFIFLSIVACNCFAFLCWINFFNGCFRQTIFPLGDKKKWLLVALDSWLSYTVTIVREFAWADLQSGHLNRFHCNTLT